METATERFEVMADFKHLGMAQRTKMTFMNI